MQSAKSPVVRLNHIRAEIIGVLEIVAGRQAEEIIASFLHSRAIERAVQIISEAAKELPAGMRETYPDAPWRAIINIGNLLRHEYYRINRRDMWDIASVHLPRLLSVVEEMLADLDPTQE